LIGIDPAQDIRVAPEGTAGRSDVDLQNRLWIESRENSRNFATRFPKLCRNGIDIGALARISQKEHGEHSRAQSGTPCDREILVYGGIRLEDGIKFFLEAPLLIG
jgi:hypothetical protein